ncbi:MAG TPA: GatB/YqeY domain-containing protein [Gemmatimonadales bacterium]|nr:GatB/YqeY domain-containing protein [Gemmatimonadales bacterium]
MPDIVAAVQGALLTARKAQDKDRTLLLGTVLSVLKNRELEVGALTEADALDVLRKQVKQRRESVEAFQKGGRADLADGEARQIRIIEEFLPPDVDPGDIRAAVRAAMDGGARDVGKLMGQVMPAFKGRADGKLINQIVREELARG